LLDDWLEYVVANLAIQCPAIVVRRAVYERLGGFDESYDFCLDYDMWQRIAMEYPLWFDPRPLAEYRAHGQVRRSSTWFEVRRCRDRAIARLSPPARQRVDRSARRHTVRLALKEIGHAVAERDWRRSMRALAGAAANGRPRDFLAVARGRFDVAPTSRAPRRPPDIAARRLPRILLITEFYPVDPVACVFGAYQRLQRHIETLSRIGPVDAVFFWPEHEISPEEALKQSDMVKKLWPIEGRVRFIKPASGRRRPLEWIADMLWALRGAMGFYDTAVTMRTCGREQAAALRRGLCDLQPDLVFAHRLGGAAPLLRTKLPLPPVVIDIDDIEHVKLTRLAASIPRSWRRRGILAQASLARHALRRMSRMGACLLVASELDRSKIQAFSRRTSIAVIPNTGAAFGAVPEARNPVALFVGNAGYPPNREGLLWLIREIWPLVRHDVPDARLVIVGAETEQLAGEGSGQGVDALGFVPDLGPVYAQARIAVCPVRRGAGTRIKIIEAAMNARPVVSTVIGAEGLSFLPDTEIMLEDGPAGFARACAKLLLEPDLAARIGTAAQRRAEAHYSATLVAERLASLCVGLIDHSDFAVGELGKKFDDPAAPLEIGQWPAGHLAR
jgi:glycosyltransferase involved in cell wall biosynthesis